MARFSVNPHRQASYKRFNFQVILDGQPIPGVSRVSGLERSTEVVAEQHGGGPSSPTKSPGTTSFEPIVLERGRTHDDTFEEWANKVAAKSRGEKVSLKDYKRDIVIELQNEAGQVAMRFQVYRCWPSSYTALSDLDAMESATAVESLTLQHEGWERDRETSEPAEPSYSAGESPNYSKHSKEDSTTDDS